MIHLPFSRVCKRVFALMRRLTSSSWLPFNPGTVPAKTLTGSHWASPTTGGALVSPFNPGCQQSRSIAAWAMPARDNKSEASESTVVFPAPLDPEMIRSGVVAGITMGLTLLLTATPSPFAITFGGARLPYERRLGGTKATIDAPFPLHAKFHIDEAHAVL